jgi:hypothetical protein
MTVDITENTTGSRFEARVDGDLAGILDYQVNGSVVTMPHTVVEPRFEGQGIGSALAQAAVGAARDRGWTIVPACWFVARWLDQHPDEQDLLARSV